MSSSCICSSPPPAAHQHRTHIHALHAHMHVSSQADTFTLGRLQASFFHFFVCRLSPALSSVSLLVQCCRFVCQLAIKARLCLHLPFLPSLTSPLFFISSLPLAPLWSINKWPLLCFFFFLNVKWSAPVNFCQQQALCSLFFPISLCFQATSLNSSCDFNTAAFSYQHRRLAFVTLRLVFDWEEMALFQNQLLPGRTVSRINRFVCAKPLCACALSDCLHPCKTKICFVIPHTVA